MQAQALLQPASGYHTIGQPGVDSKHFRYVRDIEVTVQGLVGDVPGGTADHSVHF